MNVKATCVLYTVILSLVFINASYLPLQGKALTSDRATFKKNITSLDSSQLVAFGRYVETNKYIFTKLKQKQVLDHIQCIETAIPLTHNKTVNTFIHSYLAREARFVQIMLQRAPAYFPLLDQLLHKHGLPNELKYLPILESNLNPSAVSPREALGLWQFTSSTGKIYNLYQDAYIDERLDPYKATEAACLYLKDMYKVFGDWHLALAAYNAGPGNVRRAIRKAGNQANFWRIARFLPKETQNYVPKFLAITLLMRKAEQAMNISYSLTDLVALDTILVNQYTDLQVLAQRLHMPLEELRALNPQVKKNSVPGYLKNYCLRVPAAKKEWLAKPKAPVNSGDEQFQEIASADSFAWAYATTLEGKVILYQVRPAEGFPAPKPTYDGPFDSLDLATILKGTSSKGSQRLLRLLENGPEEKRIVEISAQLVKSIN